jgi:hypothetical protein
MVYTELVTTVARLIVLLPVYNVEIGNSRYKPARLGRHPPNNVQCSGDDPCQRCIRGGQPCSFSDDRTAPVHSMGRSEYPLQSQVSPPDSRGETHTSSAVPDIEARVASMEAALKTLAEYVSHKADASSAEQEDHDMIQSCPGV